MDYRRVTVGEEVSRSASRENAWTDAAAWVKQYGGDISTPGGGPLRMSDIVLVKNTSGVQVDRYRAMALRDPVVLPSEKQSEFDKRVVQKVVTPTSNDKGRWCVLLASLNNNAIGPAVVAGVVQCRVNVLQTGDTQVEIADGQIVPVTGKPTDGKPGLAQLLWVVGGAGTASATGVQDAVIRLGTRLELPQGEFTEMVWKNTSLSQMGMDFPRLHALP